MRGSKRFVLFEPDDARNLYENELPRRGGDGAVTTAEEDDAAVVEAMRSDARYFPRRSAITGDVERARADPATLARFPRLRDATPHVVTLRAGESSWALLLLRTDSSPLLSRSEMGQQRVASGSVWCLLHQKKRIRTIR